MLYEYLKFIGLPDHVLESKSAVSHLFLDEGITTFWYAINYIKYLPYRRTSDRGNYFQVLQEKRGVCSTKHALIASLAQELSIPVKLVLGIFLLNSENMPKLKPILAKYGLEAIPEAHCFLEFQGQTLDITFPEGGEFFFKIPLQKKIFIFPNQIGSYKVSTHQDFIQSWANNQIHFDLIWQAREEWIASLFST